MWKVLLAASAVALLSLPAAAQLYKWVDEKGVTHYSEKPPPDGRAKSLDIKTQGTGPNAGSAAPGTPNPGTRGAGAKGSTAKAAQPPRTPLEEELAQLSGNWATPAGRSPSFSILFQSIVGEVMAQYALKGSTKAFVASGNYELSGGGGKGALKADLSSSDRELGLAAERIDYAIKGDEMEVTLKSGAMAGTYRVIRAAR